MEIENYEKVVYNQAIPSLFWVNFKIIAEYVKTEIFGVINLNLSNWLYVINHTESIITKRKNWNFSLVWISSEHKFNRTTTNETLDQDLDDLVYFLTYDMQKKILLEQVDYVCNKMKKFKINITYVEEKRDSNVVYSIFCVDYPKRLLNMFIKDSLLYYELDDKELKSWQTLDIEDFDITDLDFIRKWLIWNKILIVNN